MRTNLSKFLAAVTLGGVLASAAPAGASALLLPAVQFRSDTTIWSGECWDWTNEDGTSGSECR